MLKLASFVAWAGLCLVASAPACRRNDVADRAHVPDKRQQGPAKEVAIDLTPGEPAGANRFRNDPLWQRAGVEHAEIDLMRLANREGAAGLLEGLSVGRNVGLTALAALPHAEDAELALSRLCDLLARPGEQPPNPSLPVLRSVQGIAARPPEQREVLAASAYAGCVPVIERLAKSPNLDAERHDLASSAAGSLVEHRDAARR